MLSFSLYKTKDIIHNGKNSLIYRAIQNSDHKNVIIKVLKSDPPSPQQIARFLHEFEISKQLYAEIPSYIVQPLGLIKQQNTYALVFEDFGATSLSKLLAQGAFGITSFLDLALRMSEILKAIHSLHVVIKDVNPSNILWNPETNVLKFGDFGIATTLSFENIEGGSIYAIEGSPTYISPEQTGRMNRVVDYRSDFYSLGVTFYEMLTGSPPFKHSDPYQLVNAHLHHLPIPPQTIDSSIPSVLSNIVLKLLNKNPEDRYQTLIGLITDLKICKEQWTNKRTIAPFLIGFKDISSRFKIPEKLYGRENFVKELNQAFERISHSKVELFLIRGEIGQGKTSLVQELHKKISAEHGYLISGKCTPYEQKIPYYPIIQALQRMIELILLETPEEIVRWKKNFIQALPKNGKIITDLIPNLKIIIGPQPEIVDTGIGETKNRFNYTFCSFIQAIAQASHPLILFLDDLHWIDESSIDLLTHLLTNPETHHLLVIGTVNKEKENEASPALIQLIRSLSNQNFHAYRQFDLNPLEPAEVNQLLSETLHTGIDKISNLSSYVLNKTKGNPFFLQMLIQTLYKERLILFDLTEGHWKWDIIKINSKNIPENLQDFVTEKILSLSHETQNLLSLASCCGYKFNLKILSEINGKSAEKTSQELWKAMEEGIIFPENENYKFISSEDLAEINYRFVHDLYQQAAYQLLPNSKKTYLHYKIGKTLLENWIELETSDQIFVIVNQCNRGVDHLATELEKKQLSELNLKAGRLAKKIAALKIAEYYFETSLKYLPSHAWEIFFNLTSALFKEYYFILFHNGHESHSEIVLKELLKHTQSPLERASIHYLQELEYISKDLREKSIEAALLGLDNLDIHLSRHPTLFALIKEYVLAKWNLLHKQIPDLIDLPPIEDPKLKLALNILSNVEGSIYFTGSKILHAQIILKMLNLVLKNGNTEGVAQVYMSYAVFLCFTGHIKEADQFGKLAMASVDRYNDEKNRGRMMAIYAVIIQGWNYHWKSLKHYFKEVIELGLQSGDSLTASIGCSYLLILDPEKPITTILQEGIKYLNFIKHYGYEDLWRTAKIQFQAYANLAGSTLHPLTLNTSDFDENECYLDLKKSQFHTGIVIYHLCKLKIYYYHENFEKGLAEISIADPKVDIIRGVIHYVKYCCLVFFTYSAVYPKLAWLKKYKAWLRMLKEHRKFKRWARLTPINFSHIQILMEAELARHQKRYSQAEKLYEEAVQSAKKNQYILFEALANELAFSFFLQINKEKLAKMYFVDAYLCYQKWGNLVKLTQFEKRFPQWIPKKSDFFSLTTKTSSFSKNTTNSLNFFGIVDSSQLITREIKLSAVLEKTLDVLIQQIGAPKGYLLLKEEDHFTIRGMIADKQAQVTQLSPESRLPITLLSMVENKKNPILLGNASDDTDFGQDPYIKRHQTKSILAFPLLNLNVFKGVIYLEHESFADFFTDEHLNILSLLSTQIAIAIDNAFFYSQLEDLIQDRKKLLKDTQDKLIQKEKMAFMGILTEGIAQEVKVPMLTVTENSFQLLSSITQLQSLINEEEDIDVKNHLSQLLETLKDNFLSIQLQGQKADSTVNLMLDYTSKKHLEFSLVDIQLLINHVLDEIRPKMEKQYPDLNVKIETQFDPTLKYLKIIKEDIKKVLTQLIDNAYYAMNQKKQKDFSYEPSLSIKTIESDQKFLIIVKDNGIGIKPEDKDKIFVPFYTTKHLGQGIGLGLSFSYNIMTERHGGLLSFKTQFNEFTEFTLEFPRKTVEI